MKRLFCFFGRHKWVFTGLIRPDANYFQERCERCAKLHIWDYDEDRSWPWSRSSEIELRLGQWTYCGSLLEAIEVVEKLLESDSESP